MGYDYGFEYTFPGTMEGAAEGVFVGAAGIFTGILLIAYLLGMAFAVVSYVLNAVGMYRIAKRRGIHHAWLAWVPVGASWLLGSISDHYQYVAKQKNTSRRKILLILSIILAVLSCAFIVAALVLALTGIGTDTAATIFAAAIALVGYLGMTGLSIAVMVFCYIAYFDLFRSCKPKYDVLFLVLGVFFNVTLPFFVFACSGSDEGMPPRQAPQPSVQPEEPQEEESAVPLVESWEEEIPVVDTQLVEEAELAEDPE